MAEPQPVLDDDGQTVIGWSQQTDYGPVLAWDAGGDFAGAAIDGQWYAPDELEYGDEDAGQSYEYDYEAEALQQRLAELEERAEQPQYVPYPAPDPGPDPEVMAADLVAQGAHLEARLGRPLTHAEHRAIGAELREQEIAGEQRLDVQGAVDRLHERGQAPPDIDAGSPSQRRQARQQLMAELHADHEREDAAQRGEDDLALPEPPGRSGYDLDVRQQRTAYVMDRLRGQAEPADTFSGSDYPDSGGETYDPDAA